MLEIWGGGFTGTSGSCMCNCGCYCTCQVGVALANVLASYDVANMYNVQVYAEAAYA